jgi:hypothetical protein
MHVLNLEQATAPIYPAAAAAAAADAAFVFPAV